MRIGYLYDFEAYPPRGGNHVHAFELTQGVLRAGHSVAVVDDPTMPGTTNYGSQTKELIRFLRAIDILYVRIDARFTRHWHTLRKCMELADGRPVVWEINAPANEGLAYSWLGGWRHRDSRTQEGAIRRLRRHLHAWRQRPGITLEERHRRHLAQSVSSAICVSSALSRYASATLRIAHVRTLPNGGPLISPREILARQKNRKTESFTVLYAGSAIYPWQGLDFIAATIELAKQQAVDMTFALAVNQRVPSLPDGDNVVTLESLGREDLFDAICAADACVALHPEYPWAKYGFHNSPLKLFEYMACMRPVVTSNRGQMREIINDGKDGLLCADDPQDILAKLVYLRNNPDHALQIGHEAWKRVQREFNWPHIVDETLNVFDASMM